MANTTKKITKKDQYSAIQCILKAAQEAGMELAIEGISYESLTDFINHEIELLNTKADAAKERAAKKKVEGDALREKVYNILNPNEAMIISDIVKALDDEDVTAQMVTARLTQLVKTGEVEKTTVTVPTGEGKKNKKLSAYKQI